MHEGVQQVDRWQTTDGQLWESQRAAEAEQAALNLQATLLGDLCSLDVDEADVAKMTARLCEDPGHYIELLQAILETANAVEEQAHG